MSDNTEYFGSERYRKNLKTIGFFTTRQKTTRITLICKNFEVRFFIEHKVV